MLTNVQVRDLMGKELIRIEPFEPSLLESNHYRLMNIEKIVYTKFDKEGILVNTGFHHMSDGNYCLAPGEYVVVSIAEKIVLGHGVFGEFYPASICIEEGLLLNCGRLNSFYEDSIRFGLCNVSSKEFVLRKNHEIARVFFTYVGENTPIEYKKNDGGDEYKHRLEILRKEQEEVKRLEDELKAKKELVMKMMVRS